MGGRIDRAALFLLTAIALYLFFLNAWKSIAAACALTFVSMGLLRKLRARRAARRTGRCTAAQADEALWRLTLLNEAEAGAVINGIIRRKYPRQPYTLATILRMQEGKLTRGDVLSAWKGHRDAEILLLAATCEADAAALAFARALEKPGVAIADRRVLAGLLRECGIPEELKPVGNSSRGNRVSRLLKNMSSLRVRPKALLYAVSLLFLYQTVGHVLYLVSALLLIFAFGISLARRGYRADLFS